MTTTNTGAACLSDAFETLIDIYQDAQNGGTIEQKAAARGALKAAFKSALMCSSGSRATPTPQADAAPNVDGLPPLPAPIEIDWPELHSQALGCGVEDRNIRDRYEAAEYGWQDGVDRAAERVPEEIFTADQMREYARDAIAAGGAQEPLYQTCFIQGQWRDVDRAEYDRAKGLRSDLARTLYAATLPREAATLALTDEQIFDIKRGSIGFGPITGPDIPKFARALLAASNGEQK